MGENHDELMKPPVEHQSDRDRASEIPSVKVNVGLLPAFTVTWQESFRYSPEEEEFEPSEYVFPQLTLASGLLSSPATEFSLRG